MDRKDLVIGTLTVALAINSVALTKSRLKMKRYNIAFSKMNDLVSALAQKLDDAEVPLTEADKTMLNDI